MSFTTKTRYPTCPKGFTLEQEQAWNTLVRALEQKDYAIQIGPSEAWGIGVLKNGTLAKGFTNVSVSPFYCATSTGTILADSSAGNLDIYLTTASNSKDARVAIKKVKASNHIVVHVAGSANIDDTTNVTISAHNDSMEFICDGTQWWVLNRH